MRQARPLLYPLPEDMTASQLVRLARLSGSDAARYRRADAIPIDVADRIACALGSHIDILWPEVAWIDEWVEQSMEDTRQWVKRWMRKHCG